MARPLASVVQRVNAERLAVLGWPAAILMQLAHPLVAEGVYEHSSFRRTPAAAAGRLHATIQAMLRLGFGDPPEHQRALDGIREVHRRVHGTLPHAVGPFAAGTPYSAEDPDLVLWVHLTLLDVLPRAFELMVGPLGEAERDAYCAQAAGVAVALGARAPDVPSTWGDLQAQMRRVLDSGVLVVSPHAHELHAAVMQPRLARWAPPLTWHHRLLTAGLLPPDFRTAYGIPWTAQDERRFQRVVAVLHRLRSLSPDRLALWAYARHRA